MWGIKFSIKIWKIDRKIKAQSLFEAQSLIEAHPTRGSKNRSTCASIRAFTVFYLIPVVKKGLEKSTTLSLS